MHNSFLFATEIAVLASILLAHVVATAGAGTPPAEGNAALTQPATDAAPNNTVRDELKKVEIEIKRLQAQRLGLMQQLTVCRARQRAETNYAGQQKFAYQIGMCQVRLDKNGSDIEEQQRKLDDLKRRLEPGH